MLEYFLNLLFRRRKFTFLLAMAALAAAVFFASGLSMNDSPERWAPASAVESWHQFSEHYEYADTIALGLHFLRDIRDEDVEFLAALRADLMHIEGVSQVIDVSLVAKQIENVSLTDLIEPAVPGHEDPFSLYRSTLFDDAPSRVSLDASGPSERRGRTLMDFILLKTETTEGLDERARREEINTRRRRVVSAAYDVLDKHRRDDVSFHMVGGTVVQYELEMIARRLLITLVPLSLLLALLALGVGFRSPSAVGVAVLGGAWSAGIMLGGVALAGWTLNAMTVAAPTLMAVIVFTSAVHFSHYHSEPVRALDRAKDGGAASRSLVRGDPRHFIRWVAVPCLGAALVTGIGFLMLAFNELGPARELGIELFAGAVLAFLGAFLMWMAAQPLRTAPARGLSSGRLRRWRRLLTRRPRTVTGAMLIILCALAYATRWVDIDIDPYSFFQADSRITKALKHFDERRFGLYMVDVVLTPKESPEDPKQRKAARDKDSLVALRFQEKIRERPEIRKIISTMSVHEGAPKVELNLDIVKASLRRVVYYDTFKDWTMDLSGQDSLRVTFMVYRPEAGFRPLIEEIRAALPKERFECILTGTAVHTVLLSEGLVGGITRGLVVAVLVMSALCAVLFRSLRMTLIAFLPNAFPVLVVFGLMGVFGVPLNSGSAMVATVALGVALNDTVHFVMHYHRRRLGGATTEQALSATFGEVGRPIVLTSVVNCLGFGIFLLADFRPMYHFGLLASIAMAAALVGDLVLLPNLLSIFDRDRRNAPGISCPAPARLPPEHGRQSA